MINLKRVVLVLLPLLILANAVNANPAYVISNSADWRDVYSSMMYAPLIGAQGVFLTSLPHAAIIQYDLPKGAPVLVLSSKTQPYALGFGGTLQSQGFAAQETISDNLNLLLARNLTKVTGFIIMDDLYGYGAISVAPYAAAKQSYVLFANKKNINQIANFLSTRKLTEVLIYGQVDREVRTRLATLNPITINTGDRYSDNIEIVKRYIALKGASQVLLSNGEFIEAQLISGTEPVLFIGNANVPDQTSSYIKSSGIKVGVLIGNELVSTATIVRRQLGISVFVKFGRGARTPKGAITTVEDLDRFPMPKYQLRLELYSLRFNQANNQLEVTYHNPVAQGLYLKGTITLRDSTGLQTVGDLEPIYIEGGEYKTMVYDVKPLLENATAELFTIFGEAPKSLEYAIRATVTLERINILDSSDLAIIDAAYDKGKAGFYITIENKGKVKLYARIEIKGLIVNDESKDYGSKNTTVLEPGQKITVFVKTDALSDYDISQNPTINVVAYYGEREQSLVKTTSAEFPFKTVQPDFVFYGLVALLVLILLFFTLRKKCKECGTKNFRFKKTCRNCGQPL